MHINRYLVEFIGTFFLVLTIGLVVIEGLDGKEPIAIGAVLLVFVYAGGHISGAHYNPAVTLAIYLRGTFAAKEIIPYMIAQVLGALVATIGVRVLLGNETMSIVQAMPLQDRVPQALVAELLFTFALCFVILNVATAKGTENNSYFGLAIAFTVMAGAFAVGDVSGGVFNPAVAIGVSALGMSGWENIWIYLVANFAAGVLAAYTFRFVAKEKSEKKSGK